MERLTRIFEENNQKYICIDVCKEKCVENNTWCPKCKPFTNVMTKLCEYEEAEEQGLLLRLPCSVGDEFFVIAYRDNKITHVRCTGYTITVDIVNKKSNYSIIWIDSVENTRDYWKLSFEEFENRCFITKEEAEQALAKMKEV